MRYSVKLTKTAVRDLDSLFEYIESRDGSQRAHEVVSQIERRINALATTPERGARPKEFRELGAHAYREILYKPYRILYQITEKTVYVFLIADGRRDMQTVLLHRLLES
jgi:toxin ParE1/3/4